MEEMLADTHSPEATACAACKEPSTELQLICAQDGLYDDEGDGCPRFCPTCIVTTPLICPYHGEVCRRCGYDINLTSPYDGGEPAIRRSGYGTCFDCADAEEWEQLRSEVTRKLVERVVLVERDGIPALRAVSALLNSLEAERAVPVAEEEL
jgi:hypothetical protein